jgi:hypothetical protein
LNNIKRRTGRLVDKSITADGKMSTTREYFPYES